MVLNFLWCFCPCFHRSNVHEIRGVLRNYKVLFCCRATILLCKFHTLLWPVFSHQSKNHKLYGHILVNKKEHCPFETSCGSDSEIGLSRNFYIGDKTSISLPFCVDMLCTHILDKFLQDFDWTYPILPDPASYGKTEILQRKEIINVLRNGVEKYLGNCNDHKTS